jgi:dihydroxyacetone kinase-like protein
LTGFSTEQLKTLAVRLAEASEQAAEELNTKDGQLGDGDLGITVSRGWREVADHVDDLPDDVGRAFLHMSKTFQRVSSSSFGTLTATALMAAAKATKGQTRVPLDSVSELLSLARDAMMARGKGNLGEKSVLDVVDAMARATDGTSARAAGDTSNEGAGMDTATLSQALLAATDKTLENFRDKPAKLGRARMFGDKTIGLDDPGMVAVQRWVQGCVGS